MAERGPARDLGQGLGSKRALDTRGKAEPSYDRIEQANSTRCQTPERALRVVEGSDCRPHRIEERAVNSHQPVIHGHCRDHGRQILRVSSRAKRGTRVKSESARDSANASALKIGFGGRIADWHHLAPLTPRQGVAPGLE